MALVHDNAAKDAFVAHRAAQELYRLGCKGQTVQLSSYAASLNGDNIADSSVGVGALMKIVERLMSYFQSFYNLEEDLQKREELRKFNTLAPFMRLPPEIIFHVLSFLSAKDLALVQLSCSALARYVCDEWLWKRLCERDFTPIKNALAGYFGKNWRWVYRSKVVIFKGRGQIKDGDVGTLITKDGRYEGEWKNGELNGYGFLVSSVGNIIEGQWKSGMGHGFGRVSYANGDLYAGQWTDGGVTGKGVCYFMEGTVYKGDWKDNAVHGRGACWFSDGNKYDGGWKLGKKDGPGVFYWKNGATWKGVWKNNKPEGKGKHYCPITNETTIADWQTEFACCAGAEAKKDLHSDIPAPITPHQVA